MGARQVWSACHCRETWRPESEEVCEFCHAPWTPVGPPHVGEPDAFGRIVSADAIAGGHADGTLFVRDLEAMARELLPIANLILELGEAGDRERLDEIANGETPFWDATDGHIEVALAREVLRLTHVLHELGATA